MKSLIAEAQQKIGQCDETSNNLQQSLTELESQRDDAKSLIKETFQVINTCNSGYDGTLIFQHVVEFVKVSSPAQALPVDHCIADCNIENKRKLLYSLRLKIIILAMRSYFL